MSKGTCLSKFKDAVFSGTAKQGRICKSGQRDSVHNEDGKVTYQLYSCPIAVVDKDQRKVKLDSCGYSTKTTKDRINNVLSKLDISKRVSQKKYNWYINGDKFEDGIELNFSMDR